MQLYVYGSEWGIIGPPLGLPSPLGSLQAVSGSIICRSKKGNRGDMQKFHMTLQFFKARGPQGHFFKKTSGKPVFRYCLGECVSNFRSASFFVWPGCPVQTHRNIYKWINEYPLPAACLTWILKTSKNKNPYWVLTKHRQCNCKLQENSNWEIAFLFLP